MSGRNHDHVKIFCGEVYELMVKEDCLWHQRSRVDWLKAGDLNTSYFHNRANQRNRKNFISKLVLENGSILEEDHGVGEAFVDYFGNLSTSNFDSLLLGIEPKVTTQMNVELIRPFSALEVKQALNQMKPLTALGPDGMPPLFFKSYWSIVGNDVTEAALSVLNNGVMPAKINHTFISLIPKINAQLILKTSVQLAFAMSYIKLSPKLLQTASKKSFPNLCLKLKVPSCPIA